MAHLFFRQYGSHFGITYDSKVNRAFYRDCYCLYEFWKNTSTVNACEGWEHTTEIPNMGHTIMIPTVFMCSLNTSEEYNIA